MQTVAIGSHILASLVVVAQATIIILVLSKITKRTTFLSFFRKHALMFAFTVALTSMLGSLFYSEIAGYLPYELCWWQRILMYPQVLLLGIALYWRKDDIRRYLIPMNVLGIMLALYHYGLQVASKFNSAVSCPATGASCTAEVTFIFGYISIPLMAASGFALILVLILNKREKV